MSTIIKEISEEGVSLIHTDNQLFLIINCPYIEDEIVKNYVIDLLDGKEHQFFVRYFEWGFPLYAAYLPNGYQNSSLSIELPINVIEYLDDAGLVSGVEIYDEELEAKRRPNRPQDCLLTICKHMNDIIHTFH
ncbi:hypothetical protein [Vibrio sp. WXL103]|uniref:hypothetical protein n=1 Tax=Vibrio sp. WXL103 TaxID=3450710 RepID=UPI003EC560B5